MVIEQTIIIKNRNCKKKIKAYGQLVLLGFDVTTFTPVAYQRHSLLTTLKRKLILWKVSRLDAFSVYPVRT